MQELLYQGSAQFKSVTVHPVVPFLVLDQYIRREQDKSHVLGAILGSINNGVMEIRHCFSVQYDIVNGTFVLKGQFCDTMVALCQKSNKSDTVLGWFSTIDGSLPPKEWMSALNEYFRPKCSLSKPVYLTIDVSLTGENIDISSYLVDSICMKDKVLGLRYMKCRCSVSASAAENKIISVIGDAASENSTVLLDSQAGSLPDEHMELFAALDKMKESLTRLSLYIEDVINEVVNPDESVTRQLFDALSTLPSFDLETSKKYFSTKFHEFELVSQLSSLARTQLEISEKLNSMVQPSP